MTVHAVKFSTGFRAERRGQDHGSRSFWWSLCATSGEAWVLGEPAGNREMRRRIGACPNFSLPGWMSGS